MTNSIKKNYIYNSVYQLLIMIVPLITTPYVSRVIGPKGLGIYSYYFSISQYFTLFIMLGLNNYGNRTIAKVKDNMLKLSETFWSIYFLQIILGIFVLVIYFVYLRFLSSNKMVSLIMSIYVFSACIDVNWFLFGMEEFRITTIRNILIKAFTTILIFVIIKQYNDIYKYCFILVIGTTLAQLVVWPYVIKKCGFYLPSVKEILVHAIPNAKLFLTVIAVSIYSLMDKIMLGYMTGPKEVGYYESALKIISVPTSLVSSLGVVMLPRISNLKNKDIDTKNMMFKSILFSAFISTSMSFGIMSISKQFVPFFYGPGYDTCITIFLILLPSCIFFSFGNVIRTQYLLPNEMDSIYIKSAFIGAAVNLVFNTILIPKLYSVGAAIGSLIAEVVVCIYQSYKIRDMIEIRKYFISYLPFVTSGLLMFFIVYNIKIDIQSDLLNMIACIIIGAISYLVLLIGLMFYLTKHKNISIIKTVIKNKD